MIRRDFLKGASMLATSPMLSLNRVGNVDSKKPLDDRQYWVNTLTRITLPVIESLASEKLKSTMPVEAAMGALETRKKVTYLEAFGRSIAGLAPWLELGPDSTTEGKLREKFIKLSISAIKNGVNPSSPDFFNFTEERQPLVDAAFFAHGLLRAPKQLWGNLDKETQQNLVKALRSTRVIKPYNSNWLLFPATIEAALLKFDHDFDLERIDLGIKEHQEWYLGDGVYGDGPEFHFDYYNSFVIQPMLLDIVK